LRSFTHISAHSVHEVCSILAARKGRARINAGGTDLLSALKKEILREYPEVLINVKTIPGLDYAEERGNLLKIGALARLADLATSPLIIDRFSVIAEAAHSVATPQTRNVATVGGNLCQDVRCWYYRYPRIIGGPVMCARKGKGPCHAIQGDNRYHALFGGKKCFAVCPSDMATALAALNGELSAVNASGNIRKIPITEFFHPLGNDLAHDEMVTEIEIPALEQTTTQKFLKFSLRNPIDFAVVSVAVVLSVKKKKCADVRIALGALSPGPLRAEEAEGALIGEPLTEQMAAKAADIALSRVKPLSMNAYKIDIARTLIKDAILACSREACR